MIKLTKDRKAIAAGFAAAKKCLFTSDEFDDAGMPTTRDRKSEFICNAIDIALDKNVNHSVHVTCMNIIKTALGSYYTVEDWLFAQKHLKSYYTTVELRCTMQVYRHRWIDSLILEYSS